MTEFTDKVAISELKATIKKQNQILLHIKAELEAAKQYNPFNLALMAGSIENMSRVIEGQTKPFIDEGCVGCCKVVDVAAKLQKELDEYKETIRLERINRQSERTVLNQKYHEDLREKDNTIEELNDENLSLRVTINDMAKKHIWYKNTIKELKDRNAEDLYELYDLDKKDIDRLKHVISARESSIDECEKIGRHNVNVLKEIINGLEAELSARKGDSAVLMKVVGMIRAWNRSPIEPRETINNVRNAVKDYLDAPEVPPDATVSMKNRTSVTFAFLELP